MANQNLTDLATLVVQSLTAVTSLDVFTDYNGNGRVINAGDLSTHLGYPLGAVVVRSTTFGAPASTVIDFEWEGVVYDHHGFFNASSPTLLTMPFNGWVQLAGGFRANNVLTFNSYRMRVRKNSGGYGDYGFQSWVQLKSESNVEGTIQTPPIIANSGDKFMLTFTSFTNARTISPLEGRTWFAIRPLAIWIP